MIALRTAGLTGLAGSGSASVFDSSAALASNSPGGRAAKARQGPRTGSGPVAFLSRSRARRLAANRSRSGETLCALAVSSSFGLLGSKSIATAASVKAPRWSRSSASIIALWRIRYWAALSSRAWRLRS